eukprot:3786058-Rhodomonas_salina.5
MDLRLILEFGAMAPLVVCSDDVVFPPAFTERSQPPHQLKDSSLAAYLPAAPRLRVLRASFCFRTAFFWTGNEPISGWPGAGRAGPISIQPGRTALRGTRTTKPRQLKLLKKLLPSDGWLIRTVGTGFPKKIAVLRKNLPDLRFWFEWELLKFRLKVNWAVQLQVQVGCNYESKCTTYSANHNLYCHRITVQCETAAPAVLCTLYVVTAPQKLFKEVR